MKKNLLIACLALSATAFGQFTDANSPNPGDSQLMYVLDTNASNMANVTGNGVTWDYSTTAGVYGETKTVDVVTAASAANGSDFPAAEIAIEIPGFVTEFNTSTPTDYNSEGFTFTEASLGTVRASFNTDHGTLMVYPYGFGGTVTDALSGTVYSDLGDFPCTGTVSTMVDGSGTLKLNSSTTLNNVLRMKTHDSININAGFLGTVIMLRTQYDYYDLANSSLPVLVHSQIDVVFGGPQSTALVLSAYAPDDYLSVDQAIFSGVSVFPNPAKDVVSIKGMTENATVVIYDLNGKAVKTVELNAGTSSISISDLLGGSYVMKATTASGTFTTKISVL